jgi:hypothetical protein
LQTAIDQCETAVQQLQVRVEGEGGHGDEYQGVGCAAWWKWQKVSIRLT